MNTFLAPIVNDALAASVPPVSSSSLATVTPGSPTETVATTTDIYHDFTTNLKYVQPLYITGAVLLALAGALLLAILVHRRPGRAGQRRKAAAWIFLAAGVVVICFAAYFQSGASRVAPTFSAHAMLDEQWTSYKANFVLQVGSSTERTIDPSQNSITTSEGESYTLLRAAWLDDQATFDANWTWTEQNLETPDHVFSWLYGEEASGTYGILTSQGGENTASDADSDIALALLFAYGRWQEPQYLTAAKQVIDGIWNDDVVEADGKPYLAADNLEKASASPVAALDPSYFSPYEYRIFAAVDPAHPWTDLLDDSYSVIDASMDSSLGGASSAELPPDWIGINKTTGALTPLTPSELTDADTNYGFDAMRLPWRLALDWEWNKDPRDEEILNKMGFLKSQWDSDGMLDAIYGHDGSVVGDYEDPAVYGGDLGYFLVSDPTDAASVYENKLLILFDPGTADWRVPLDYYDANWVWFGTALYNNELPNLAADIPSTGAAGAGANPAAANP